MLAVARDMGRPEVMLTSSSIGRIVVGIHLQRDHAFLTAHREPHDFFTHNKKGPGPVTRIRVSPDFSVLRSAHV